MENVPGNIIMERMMTLCFGRAFFLHSRLPEWNNL